MGERRVRYLHGNDVEDLYEGRRYGDRLNMVSGVAEESRVFTG